MNNHIHGKIDTIVDVQIFMSIQIVYKRDRAMTESQGLSLIKQ